MEYKSDTQEVQVNQPNIVAEINVFLEIVCIQLNFVMLARDKLIKCFIVL